MATIEELLGTAIKHYRAVLEAIAALERPGTLEERANLAVLAEDMASHWAAARDIDQKLMAFIDASGSSCQDLVLMREYHELLGQVAQINLSMLKRVRTHLALVGSELAELKGCKKALSGYRSSAEHRGRKLSGSY